MSSIGRLSLELSCMPWYALNCSGITNQRWWSITKLNFSTRYFHAYVQEFLSHNLYSHWNVIATETGINHPLASSPGWIILWQSHIYSFLSSQKCSCCMFNPLPTPFSVPFCCMLFYIDFFLQAKTPAQWKESTEQVPPSPACRGGFGKWRGFCQ